MVMALAWEKENTPHWPCLICLFAILLHIFV
jgi:hypothetical protein